MSDEVIVHHNTFRRWENVKGNEKNGRGYWDDNTWIVSEDQIYLYKNTNWNAMPGYSFIKPIKSNDNFTNESEKPLVGIVKYSDGKFNIGDLIGFKPKINTEDFINGERLYRVMNKFITIKYEYQGNEEEYNPSWTQGG